MAPATVAAGTRATEHQPLNATLRVPTGREPKRMLIMAKPSLLKEFYLFIREEKKWWLVPLIAVLLLVGALVLFASSSPLAPFLYPLF